MKNNELQLDAVKFVGTSLEEGVNKANDSGTAIYKKQKYNRYVFDFYKEPDDNLEFGGYTDIIDLKKFGKSAAKGKNEIMYYAISFGASIDLEYKVTSLEDGKTHALEVTLNSGDAFVVSSHVTGMSYKVTSTSDKYNQQLIMREGCLLLQAEAD